MTKIIFKDLNGNIIQQASFEDYNKAIEWKSEQEDSLPNWKTKEPKNYSVEILENCIDQDKINQVSFNYLINTDWYVTRFIETGIPIPEEIKLKREEARGKIVK
jgi:hypothetical protein